MPTSENAETKEQPSHDRPMRILIVDDNPGMREMMALMVRRMGYSVATATTGTEALAHLRAQRMDMMLLDLKMPDLDGFEVCRVVQRDATLQPLHIIITSARDTLEDKATCFALGAADYLTKPFGVRELHARLQVGEHSVLQQPSALDHQPGICQNSPQKFTQPLGIEDSEVL
jgi:two-component system alkaline phosphatase synthesis response regulator PhoP